MCVSMCVCVSMYTCMRVNAITSSDFKSNATSDILSAKIFFNCVVGCAGVAEACFTCLINCLLRLFV